MTRRRGRSSVTAMPAAVAGFATIAMIATACTGDVVDGRGSALKGTGAAAPQSGARFTDAASIAELGKDVTAGVQAINTYDYRSLDAARTNALRYTTGALTNQLSSAFRNVIAKNAPALQARQQAKVNSLGVATFSGANASLLVFGQIDVTTTASPQGRRDAFVLVTRAQRVSGRWLLAKVTTNGTLRASPPGTAPLGAAVRAAGETAEAITSYRRASFDADFARTLALLTGTAKTDVAKLQSATRSSLQSGNFDLQGEVAATAVQAASGTRAVVLVSLIGYRVTDSGDRGTPTRQNLRITEVDVGGRWLAERIDSIGVS